MLFSKRIRVRADEKSSLRGQDPDFDTGFWVRWRKDGLSDI